MYLAFNAPHDPRQSPQAFLDRYHIDSIQLPKNWLSEYPYKDAIGNPKTLRDEALAPFPRTPFAIRTHIKEYYAIISHLDESIIIGILAISGSVAMCLRKVTIAFSESNMASSMLTSKICAPPST